MEADRFKLESIAEKYQEIMIELGITFTPDNVSTPMRVAKSLVEMLANEQASVAFLTSQLTMFPSPDGRDIFIEVDDIRFTSICAHHHLPFIGTAIIKYIPGEQMMGLSKFPRVVEWFAKKTQTQEHLTSQIGNFLAEYMNPKRLEVKLYSVIHTCMGCRGVRSQATTSTSFKYERSLEEMKKSIQEEIEKSLSTHLNREVK